ncbi:ATP-binding protein [Paraburkholderia tropica]|uniref:ATP-binding protein n=1 Tax=Paraburkholderia tropica TaxID=92647 RepID=UPI002AB74738|nr:ATP-binding protein [Paraburkholderia tropica]
MAFEFKARVLLELGAEFVGSDAVALVDLAKNARDAKSPSVEIDIRVGMQHSIYVQPLELLDGYALDEDIHGTSDFVADSFNDTVLNALDVRATDWSRNAFSEAYGRPATTEEATRSLREAYVQSDRIPVKDVGDGMFSGELRANYLTVGTLDGLNQTKEPTTKAIDTGSRLYFTRTGERISLGEKGIGRFSAMCQGHLVRVRTKRTADLSWNRVAMDWRPVFAAPSSDVSDQRFDIQPEAIACRSAAEHADEGTTIYLRGVRSDWPLDKAIRIVNNDLTKLADFFASFRANRFLKVSYQGNSVKAKSVWFADSKTITS